MYASSSASSFITTLPPHPNTLAPVSVSTGFGLRYNLSDQASLSVNFTTAPGIQFNLMFGGLGKCITGPKTPVEDDFDLPF